METLHEHFLGKRANLPVACLACLPRLCPDHHDVTLVDENVEDIDFDQPRRAPILSPDGHEHSRTAHGRDHRGGQIARRHDRRWRCDGHGRARASRRSGRCASSWARPTRPGRNSCANGRRAAISAATSRTIRPISPRCRYPASICSKPTATCSAACRSRAAARSPASSATSSSLSAGRPRLKTSEQVIAELESFIRAGLKMLFVVDDNLIGNKKAIKPVLRDIVAWQQERGYPLVLVHRGLARPGRGRRADGADGSCQLPKCVHRHRDPERGFAQGNQEASERAAERRHAARARAPRASSTASTSGAA